MATRRQFLAALAVGVVGAGAAVGVTLLPEEDSSGEGPPALRLGEDICDNCGMVISDARFAAAWRAAEGGEARFDDIGCLVAMSRKQASLDSYSLYVRDFNDESWLEAGDASYVMATDIKTPMASGIAALGDAAAAEALAAQHNGTVLTWPALYEQFEGMGKMGEHHGSHLTF